MSAVAPRMQRPEAVAIAKAFVDLLEGTYERLVVAGSLRRRLARIDPLCEREMWFISQLADGSCAVRGARRAFAIFTHWLAVQRAKAPSYGSRW